MIKVNLQNRKAAVGVVAGSATGGTSKISAAGLRGIFEKFSGGGEGLASADTRAALILLVVYGVILGGGWWYLGGRKDEMVKAVDAEIASDDSKLTLLTSEANKTNGYEQIKKNLEADEKTIRTKIDTIQELIRDRTTPPKILTTLSESIPKDVWLHDFSLQERHFKISGSSTSMDVVSDFMKSLEETIYFKGVVLKSSRQEATKGGAVAATFEIEAERR